MTDQIEITLLNRQTEIARVQDEFEAFATIHAFPQRALHDIQLALDEHLANIVNHAYNDALEHRIIVRCSYDRHELRIEVEDDGRPFNPLEHPDPDLSIPIDRRQIGGLGIHMMRKSLDGLDYRRENGRNVLVMVKQAA